MVQYKIGKASTIYGLLTGFTTLESIFVDFNPIIQAFQKLIQKQELWICNH